MPTRMIRNWTSSEKVDLLSFGAEVFFTRLIMTVDDFGRFHANPKLLKSALFPLKEISLSDIQIWLKECSNDLIRLYNVDGKDYLEIIDFNQRLRLTKSKFPEMPVTCQSIDRHMSDNCPPETEARNGSEKREVESETEEENIIVDNSDELPPKFDFKKELINLGVDKIVATDWMKVRKNKKASNTETALKAIVKEIKQSGRSPNECITEAVARSWQGFKAEWMNKLNLNNNGTTKTGNNTTNLDEQAKRISRAILGESSGQTPSGSNAFTEEGSCEIIG